MKRPSCTRLEHKSSYVPASYHTLSVSKPSVQELPACPSTCALLCDPTGLAAGAGRGGGNQLHSYSPIRDNSCRRSTGRRDSCWGPTRPAGVWVIAARDTAAGWRAAGVATGGRLPMAVTLCTNRPIRCVKCFSKSLALVRSGIHAYPHA